VDEITIDGPSCLMSGITVTGTVDALNGFVFISMGFIKFYGHFSPTHQ
jgi:hypothetical protein